MILDECPHVVVLDDAVYADLTFDGRKHNYLCTIGNNWDRTVTMFSAGKLMNITGWRVGWAIGPQKLIYYGGVIAVTLFECWNTSGQIAVARHLDRVFSKPEIELTNAAGEKEVVTFVEDARRKFESNRDLLISELAKVDLPFKTIRCDGGYFLIVDISECQKFVPEKYLTSLDYCDDPSIKVGKYFMPDGSIPLDAAFCRWMACENGVTMLPMSKFYGRTSTTSVVPHYVRISLSRPVQEFMPAMEILKAKFKK